MRNSYLLLLALLLATPCSVQSQIIEGNLSSADDVFHQLCKTYGVNSAEDVAPVAYQTERSFYLYGHFPSPWDSMAFLQKGIFVATNDALYSWEVVYGRRDTFEVTTMVNNATVYRHDDDYETPDKLQRKDIERYRAQLARISPSVLLRTMWDQGSQCALLSTDDSTIVLGCGERIEGAMQIVVDRKSFRIRRVEQIEKGDYRGDRKRAVYYRDYAVEGGHLYPTTVVETEYGHTTSEWKLRSVDPASVDTTRFAIPADYTLQPDSPEEIVRSDLVWVPLAEHLYAVDLRHLNNRTLVVEHRDYCTVIEAGQTSAAGELIIDMVKNMLPGKPIRYFVFGHHHPDFIGGIRAFAAEGATIITPKRTVNFVRELLSTQHSLDPDRWEKNSGVVESVDLLLVEDSCVIEDGMNRLQIYNIGRTSAHTLDYLVFHFPKQSILFQGDLGLMREGRTSKLWAGERGLIEFVTTKELNVERVLQSWPLSRNGARTDFPFTEWMQMMDEGE